MIYAKLIGGIGNINFIVSTAYALALDNNDQVIFEASGIAHPDRDSEGWLKTIFRNLQIGAYESNSNHVESSFTYSEISYRPNMGIFGYFQSPLYFDHRRKEIVELLADFKKEITMPLCGYFSSFPDKTISLHIRRTDYLPKHNYHGVLPIRYYENAISQLKTILGKDYENYLFLIFSDDINWCERQPFFKSIRSHFVKNAAPPQGVPLDVFEMYLMSMCKHHIIANSSYSWWGAYLNDSAGKIVTAPVRWFNSANSGGDGPNDWSTVYCTDWVLCQ